MQVSEVPRAVAVAMSIASSLDLTVDDAIVLHDSNTLTLRLLPCDVLARVAPVAHQVAQLEVELAQRLAESESPVAALDPRVEPRV
ncbi:MAG TPA: aminoglycoside phosphotransferase family protein, partial [Actinomycetota bacterium]|nr:aminoglycoside phosphotransferase family protein [Actinomycetota bacterium]